MSRFKEVKVGQLGDVVTGKTPKTSIKENYGDDYMFIGPTDLHKHFVISKSEKMISEKGLESIKNNTINGLSILVGCIGWDMGNVALVKDKCATNQQINSITNIKKEFNPQYIYYWFKGKKTFLFKISNVTRTPMLNKTDFCNIGIQIPNISTQNQVAKTLSDLDQKIELNNQINAELEAMAKLVYDYWFVQFDFPISASYAAAVGKPELEGKPYKASGCQLVYNEELKREIPEGWGVKPMKGALDVQYGYPFSTKLFSDDEEGKAVIRIRDILKNTISTYSSEEVDEKYRLAKNDLVIGMDGNFHMNFWNDNDSWLNQRCVRVREKSDSEISIYQAYQNIKPYIEAREKNVSRTTVGHLSARDIDGLKVLIAPENEHFQHTNFFDSIVEKIIANRLENQELASLRDWLLPMLMNGQATVRSPAGKRDENLKKEVEVYGEVQGELSPNDYREVAEDEIKYGEG